MLSNNQVVKARKQLEKMYIGKCNIIAYEKIKKDNGAKANAEIVKYNDVPCRLIFINVAPNTETETIGVVKQVIQLHLAPEIEIKPGMKIEVTQNGQTAAYKSSGEPAAMLTHQEIKLVLFKGWS